MAAVMERVAIIEFVGATAKIGASDDLTWKQLNKLLDEFEQKAVEQVVQRCAERLKSTLCELHVMTMPRFSDAELGRKLQEHAKNHNGPDKEAS